MAYQGVLSSLPLGLLGLTGDPVHENPAALSIAENFEYRNGRIVRAFGLVKLFNSPYDGEGPIVGLAKTSSPADNTLHVMRGFDHQGPWGTYRSTIQAPTLGNPPSFAEGGRESGGRSTKIFIFSPNGLPLVSESGNEPRPMQGPDEPDDYEGEFSHIPAEWSDNTPVSGVVHADRLWVISGHRLYYSSPDDHEDFVTDRAGSLPIYPGEGDRISAITSFRGLLILWKYPKGLYILNTQSLNPADWAVRRVSDKLGCIHSQAFSGVDQDIIFFDTGGGLHSLGATDEFGDISSSDLTQVSEIDEWMRDNVDFNRLDEVRMAYDEIEKELHILMPKDNSPKNFRVIFDLVNRRFRVNTAGDPTSILVWRETDTRQFVLLGMREGGAVYRVDHTLDIGDSSVDDGIILREPFRIKSVPTRFEFVDPTLTYVRKILHDVRLRIRSRGDVDLKLVVTVDDTELGTSYGFDLPATSILLEDKGTPNLNDFELGISELAKTGVFGLKHTIRGATGHYFEFELKEDPIQETENAPLTNNPKGTFELLQFNVAFKPTASRRLSDT